MMNAAHIEDLQNVAARLQLDIDEVSAMLPQLAQPEIGELMLIIAKLESARDALRLLTAMDFDTEGLPN